MKPILLIDDDMTFTWCLRKYLQRRGYRVEAASSLKEAREIISREIPLLICSDIDLPDGSGLDLLSEIRTNKQDFPFLIASCHETTSYEQEAMRRGATLCMDKMKGLLLQEELVEYAYKATTDIIPPTYHKLLYVCADEVNAGVFRAAMLQKGFNLVLVTNLFDAENRLAEDTEIELILSNINFSDGTALDLFHAIRQLSGTLNFANRKPDNLLPFFIVTADNDLKTEYQYRHKGVNDYFVSPVNIPELIRRILFFLE